MAFPVKIGRLDHVVESAGSVWVGGWALIKGSEHAVVYRYTQGKWTRLDQGLEATMNVNCLQVFADGPVWAGLNPGMAHFDGTTWTLSRGWPSDGSMILMRFVARTRDIYVASVKYTRRPGTWCR